MRAWSAIAAPLTAVYALAQKITAKYGNDGYVLSRAIVPPQQLDPERRDRPHRGRSKDRSTRSNGRSSSPVTAISSPIMRPRSPPNGRSTSSTIERYLLLAGDLPGLKFRTSLRPSQTTRGASTLVVEVTEKRIDANGHIDNRGTPARGPFEYSGLRDAQQYSRSARSADLHLCGRRAARRNSIRCVSYRQVLTSEGLTFLPMAATLGARPERRSSSNCSIGRSEPYGDAGLSYPVCASREQQHDAVRAWSTAATTTATCWRLTVHR